VRTAPGKTVEHTERWWLLKDVKTDFSEKSIEANVKGKVEALVSNGAR